MLGKGISVVKFGVNQDTRPGWGLPVWWCGDGLAAKKGIPSNKNPPVNSPVSQALQGYEYS